MAYHAKNGHDFVGLRTAIGGHKQIVYDDHCQRRIIINICDSTASEAKIDEALKEGISANNVLRGIILALKVRDITIDIAC